MKESISLIKYNVDGSFKFIYIKIQENVVDFQKVQDCVVETKIITTIEELKKYSKVNPHINFKSIKIKDLKTNKLDIEIESPTTQKFLQSNRDVVTILTICKNQTNETLGYILCNDKGQIFIIDKKQLITKVQQRQILLTNAFFKQVGLQYYKGCYIESINKMTKEKEYTPIILTSVFGTKLKTEIKEEKDENITDAKVNQLYDKYEKFNPIVQLMIDSGYEKEVIKYKLYNKQFKDNTLAVYYNLLRDKKGDFIGKMLTTEDFSNAQLHEIQMGLEKGIDITQYANVLFSAEQMRQARKSQTIFDGSYIPIPKNMEIARRKAKTPEQKNKVEKTIKLYKEKLGKMKK